MKESYTQVCASFCQSGEVNDNRCYGCCVGQGCGTGGRCSNQQCLCNACASKISINMFLYHSMK